MRRSERIQSNSREAAGWSAVLFAVAAALACWTPSAWLIHPMLGFGACSFASVGMVIAFLVVNESRRLRRLAKVEADIEAERMIRPRL